MKTQRIHLQNYPTKSDRSRDALLFVHGGYANSTCWEFNFIPFFQDHGYACSTVDLSGHGRSKGKERLDEFGIDDYAEDLACAIREIGCPVTLIGHSMGCRVIERYLTQGDAEAAIFLAPVPTTGTVGSAISLALRYPGFFEALAEVASGNVSDEAAELMAKVYFSPRMSAAETKKYLPMVGPESALAVAEIAIPEFGLSVRCRKLPALVVGGQYDAVFPASMLHFMASIWNAEVHRVDGAGHMLMLDPQWRDAADYIHLWMAKKNLSLSPTSGTQKN